MSVKKVDAVEQSQELLSVKIPLYLPERSRFDTACGPGRPVKRGQWVREAILEKLEREEKVRASARKECEE